MFGVIQFNKVSESRLTDRILVRLGFVQAFWTASFFLPAKNWAVATCFKPSRTGVGLSLVPKGTESKSELFLVRRK